MKKPPLQFGLQAIILVTSGVAVVACLAVPGAQQIQRIVALGGIAALATASVLAAAVLIAFGFSLSMLLYHSVRPVRDWIRNFRRRGQSLP